MITTKSKINFSNLSVPPIIPVVQGDTGRVIQFELNDFTIPAGATATYYVQKPSGEAVYNEATISGNNVFVELTAQSIIEVGENYGQVRILVDEEVVTSFDFILLVKVFRGIDAVQSESEMNIFDKAVERAQETIASTVTEAEAAIEAAAQEAEEYIAQAIDPTLTITDKAADAKVTGDGLKGIAAAFDPQEQYFAGDYVLHDFKLYRRVADCTSVWGDGSWIAANWAEAKLGTDINQRVRIAASEYDHTRDYAVGEYCTHDRWMYRCISPVTGGSTGDIGNWDATKWEAVRIGEELTDLKEAISELEPGLSDDAKTALLNCFQHVAWIDEHGQDYYDALYAALHPGVILIGISATFDSGDDTIFADDSLEELKQYLTVIANYSDGTQIEVLENDYVISGTLQAGSSTLSVSAYEKSTDFTVNNIVDYYNRHTITYPSDTDLSILRSYQGDQKVVGSVNQFILDPMGSDRATLVTNHGKNNSTIRLVDGSFIDNYYIPVPSDAKSVTMTWAPISVTIYVSFMTWYRDSDVLHHFYRRQDSGGFISSGTTITLNRTDFTDMCISLDMDNTPDMNNFTIVFNTN
jgi:hypothetical protein